MKSDNFYVKLTKYIQKHLGEDWTAELQPHAIKNNGTSKVTLLLSRNGDILKPQIYLEEFYEDYQNGTALKEIMDKILEIYEYAIQTCNSSHLANLKTWETAKQWLAFQLISKEKNRERLSDYVYEDFCDLAAVVRFCLEINPEGIKSMYVTNDLIKYWNTTREEVLSIARVNTEKLFPPKISRVVDEIPKELAIPPANSEKIRNKRDKLMVLTNTLGIRGATVIMYDSFMKEVYERMQGKFFILPCSIHEVIIFPIDKEVVLTGIRKTVHMVNRLYVHPDEYLSNQIYYYNGEKVVLLNRERGEI